MDAPQIFVSSIVFARFKPKCCFCVLLLVWVFKSPLLMTSKNLIERVLGASMIFMAQGLPKAGEGPARKSVF